MRPGRHPGAVAWRRFRAAARSAGAVRVLLAAPLWVVRPRYAVTCFEHGPGAPYPPCDLTGLDLVPVDAREFDRVRTLEPGVDAGELARRLDEGLEGRLVLERGAPVYLRWDAWGDHRLPYLGATFRLHPGDHHPALAVTRPDRRGAGLHGRLLAWSLDEARRRGCRRSFGLVASWNVPSVRAVTKPGWRAVGTIARWGHGPAARLVGAGAVRCGPGASFEIVDETAARERGGD